MTKNANCWLCLIVVLLFALLQVAWAARSSRPPEIPFTLYRGHFVVASGNLGSLRQRRLLIDTGSAPTMIDLSIAKQLGLTQTGKNTASINVLNGSVPAYYAVLAGVDLGPIHCESLPVAVTDLSWLRGKNNEQIDAIVGLDVLSHTNFQIDYESRKIWFGAIRIPRSTVPMVDLKGMIAVDAEIDGNVTRLMIDTGGVGVVLFKGFVPEITTEKRTQLPAKIASLGGRSELQKFPLHRFDLGRINLDGMMALRADTTCDCEFQGILGISGEQMKRVGFDFQRQRVGFELRDDAASMAFVAGQNGEPGISRPATAVVRPAVR